MKSIILIALVAAAPVRAQQTTSAKTIAGEIEAVLDQLEANPADAESARRARVIMTALGMSGEMQYRSPKGDGQCDGTLQCYYDCSGYVAAVLAPTVNLPRDTADKMYRRANAAGAVLSVEPNKPGDILFFKDRNDPTRVGHTAIYLGGGRFVHMFGKPGSPIRISSFSDLANTPGAKVKYDWHSKLQASADLSRLPAAGASFDLARKAAGGATTVRATAPGEPGGVYISPEVIYQAMSKDRAGVLNALESIVLSVDFSENPVQGIDIEIPPDFDR